MLPCCCGMRPALAGGRCSFDSLCVRELFSDAFVDAFNTEVDIDWFDW